MAKSLETPPSQVNVSHYSSSPHHLKPPTALVIRRSSLIRFDFISLKIGMAAHITKKQLIRKKEIPKHRGNMLPYSLSLYTSVSQQYILKLTINHSKKCKQTGISKSKLFFLLSKVCPACLTSRKA